LIEYCFFYLSNIKSTLAFNGYWIQRLR